MAPLSPEHAPPVDKLRYSVTFRGLRELKER